MRGNTLPNTLPSTLPQTSPKPHTTQPLLHPRTSVRGSPDRTPNTNFCVSFRGFAASREPTRPANPRPAAATCRQPVAKDRSRAGKPELLQFVPIRVHSWFKNLPRPPQPALPGPASGAAAACPAASGHSSRPSADKTPAPPDAAELKMIPLQSPSKSPLPQCPL